MVNKVILVGNVGLEPEVRALETGIKMARLRVATTERIYNASTGEKREHTEWHSVVLWRGQADFAEKYIHKGSLVYVEGKIRSREWTEEATGNKRYALEILAEEVRLLGGGGRRSEDNPGEQRPAPTVAQAEGKTEQAVHQTVPPTIPSEGEPERAKAPQMPKNADDLPF